MKGQNYGVQISKSIVDKTIKEVSICILISLIISILVTYFYIDKYYNGGFSFFFELISKKIFFYIKLDVITGIAKQVDYDMSNVVNKFWDANAHQNMVLESIFISSLIICSIVLFFMMRLIGKSYQSKKYERADELKFVTSRGLKKEIKEEVKRKNNDIEYTDKDMYVGKNNIKIPFGICSVHFGFAGASRTGKTNAMTELLIQDRVLGSKCLIVDPTGQFFKKHGKKGDHILSLYDTRQKKWDFWHENLPFKFLADALVEVKDSSSQTKFFDKSGREVLAAVLKHTSSLEELWQVVNYDEASLYKYLLDKKELSKQLLGKKASGQSAGVIASSILNMSFIKSMNNHVYEREKEINKEEEYFSLTKWVENDDDDSWVFIIDDNRNLPEARPLHRLWFDIVTSSAYDRNVGKNNLKQINMYCDEISTVGNLPTLPSVLDKGRNYKLRLIIGFQSYHQLELIYGQDMARNIFQGLQNVFIFASNDFSEARIFSERMGKSSIVEVDQSLSLQDKNDHASLSYRTREIECVTASQIQALKDNICFVKIARFNPTKIEFKFHKLETVNEGSLSKIPSRTIFDDIILSPYVSEEEILSSENKNNKDLENSLQAQEQLKEVHALNESIKSLVESTIKILSAKEVNDGQREELGIKIIEKLGSRGGMSCKINTIEYAISTNDEKSMIYVALDSFNFALPFPESKKTTTKIKDHKDHKDHKNKETKKGSPPPHMAMHINGAMQQDKLIENNTLFEGKLRSINSLKKTPVNIVSKENELEKKAELEENALSKSDFEIER